MEQDLKILLIEDDPYECEAIIRYLDSINELAEDGKRIRLVAVTRDIVEAIESAELFMPDAVILDIELKTGRGNGLFFLEKLQKIDVSPYILITTRNVSTITYERLRELGADFIMSKHQRDYSAETVIEFLRSMKDVIKRCTRNAAHQMWIETPADMKNRISRLVYAELDRIISPKLLGKKYLAAAIELVVEKGRDIRVCEEVAKLYTKSASSVERSMQNAISSAWKNPDEEHLKKCYTAQINSKRGSPTLLEFIFYYAEKVSEKL